MRISGSLFVLFFVAGSITAMDWRPDCALASKEPLLRTVLRRTVGSSVYAAARDASFALGTDHSDESELAESVHSAAREGNLALMQQYAEEGHNLNERDSEGNAPIHYAAENGHLEVVRFLLAHGVSPETRDGTGWTALHYAAWEGHNPLFVFLLTHGAFLNARNNLKKSSIDLARNAGNLGILRIARFLQGVKLDLSNLPDGLSMQDLLCIVVAKGHEKLVRRIVTLCGDSLSEEAYEQALKRTRAVGYTEIIALLKAGEEGLKGATIREDGKIFTDNPENDASGWDGEPALVSQVNDAPGVEYVNAGEGEGLNVSDILDLERV